MYYLYLSHSRLCLLCFKGQIFVWIVLPFCTCLITYTVVYVLLLCVANKCCCCWWWWWYKCAPGLQGRKPHSALSSRLSSLGALVMPHADARRWNCFLDVSLDVFRPSRCSVADVNQPCWLWSAYCLSPVYSSWTPALRPYVGPMR